MTSTAPAALRRPNACAACRETGEPLDFTMAFQPIVDLEAGRIWGHEALVRTPTGGPAAEVLAAVDGEGRYRFDQACRVKAIELAGRLFGSDELMLSINFMPNAVYEPKACIRATLAAALRVGFRRDRLMFEFTEDERVRDAGHLGSIIGEYRRQGFLTAVDDFGAGYSGLCLLASLQPDLIKLDMHLLRNLDREPARRAVVGGVVAIARRIGVEVLAEGVETAGECAALREEGVRLFQGYLFARPAFEALATVRFDG
jgi:EAL domain-containing protein (putative c-di-GMP-specific phosphodiesterase class I)